MIKKIKEYFNQKKGIRILTLDTLYKINSIATTANDVTNTLSSITESLDTSELKSLADILEKISTSLETTAKTPVPDYVPKEKGSV